MGAWKPLFDQRRWDEIDNLWPSLPPAEQRALFIALLEGVPKVVVIEGVEQTERHVRPNEAPSEWKGAAKILALGELEAEIEGDPPASATSWAALRTEAETYLRETIADCERETQGARDAGELSREQHSRTSLDLLAAIDRATTLMCAEMDSDTDREWLAEVMAEIAEYAFIAGRHMQAAWGKPFEGHAVRGIKTIQSAAEGGRQRRGKVGPETAQILAHMQQLINAGQSQSRAAYHANIKGLGSSQSANLKLYQRMRKAKS